MITFYLYNNPAYIGVPQQFQVGYIDSTGALTSITGFCTVEILQPTGVIITDTNNFVINSIDQNITVYIKVTYLTNDPVYFSYCFIQQLSLPMQEQLYNTFINYLPQNVYNTNPDPQSPVYCDNQGLITALSQIYQNELISNPQFTDLSTVISQFFPESGDPAWEQYLVGTNSLYLQNTTNYADLLVLLYQTNVNNNTNPYWAAYYISQYIYYRLGILKYVYIGEDVFSAYGAFILNLNSLGHTIMVGENNVDVSPTLIHVYIVEGDLSPVIPLAFRQELYTFIRRIIRAGMKVDVSYDQTFTSLGLININDTYWKDPRQNNSYCIQFNPGVLAQALGYTGGSSTVIITDFTLTLSPPASGGAMTLGTTYTVTITPVYSTPAMLPNPIINYTEFFSSDYNVVTTYLNSGTEYFYANSIGTIDITVYLGLINHTFTYTVS